MFESFLGVNPWTALFILLNTLTIFFVARRFLFNPVMEIITDRQREIDDLYTNANSARNEAENLRTEYQTKLSVARTASEQIMKEAVTRGQAREEDIIRRANTDAATIMDKAYANIALEKKKAINEAKNEISALALAIAGKVVERELTASDQKKLIDRFIEELGDDL